MFNSKHSYPSELQHASEQNFSL